MKRVKVVACDHLNLARGKYLAMSKLDAGVTRLCQGVYGVTYTRDLIPAPGSKLLEGLPDMEARWQQGAERTSWVEDETVVVADFYDTNGAPLGVCGRQALKRVIADWEVKGLTPMVGIELEAYAFVEGEDGQLKPMHAPGSFVYATGPHADPYGFTDAIWETAEKVGFPLELITTEYDAAQFEFVLTYSDALDAVDNTFLFKQMAREVAAQKGVVLSFMPKPITDRGGNGMHVNFSLFDKDGNNVIMTGDKGGPDNLSEIGRGCLSGLIQHHQALAGVIAPTVNSYERLRPASLSGYWQNWGGDHRSVTSRVSSEGGKKARIEHRMADAGANPYTMTAAILRAALLGVENGYDLPEPETNDGLETVNTKVGVGENLGQALDHLEADTVFTQALGQELVDNHVFIKRAEIEEVAGLSTPDEKRDYYIHFI